MTETEFHNTLDSLHYDKEDLYLTWFKPIEKFIMRHINETIAGTKILNLLGNSVNRKQLRMTDIKLACAKFYTNEQLLKVFYDAQPKDLQILIDKATWNEVVKYNEINKLFKKQVFKVDLNNNSFYQEPIVHIDKVIANWEGNILTQRVWDANTQEEYFREADLLFVFPDLMKTAFSNILPAPTGYHITPITQPKDTTVFNAEKAIFKEMPLILTHYFQDKFRYTKRGYPNRASVRKMNKQLDLATFPGHGPTDIRMLLIAGLFTDKFKLKSPSKPTLEVLHDLFNTDFLRHPNIPYLLPHLARLNNFRPGDFQRDITNKIFYLLHSLPTNQWISFSNIKKYCKYHFIPLFPLRSFYDLDRIDTAGDIEQYPNRFQGENIRSFLEFPYLAGHIYLMAALGLMEIAVDETASPGYSYYDGLKACRLTNLGAHIFGLKEDYTPPKIENETKLNFDENAPVIRVQGNLSLGQAMLEKYAEKVSDNRYQFSPGKFLKGCRTKKDLKNKIMLFKETIPQELPPFWIGYLNQLTENSQAIKKKSTIEVFKLPSEDKELHRLIARDSILRNLIIKAEGFYILIEKNKKGKFQSRMKELGYLIG